MVDFTVPYNRHSYFGYFRETLKYVSGLLRRQETFDLREISLMFDYEFPDTHRATGSYKRYLMDRLRTGHDSVGIDIWCGKTDKTVKFYKFTFTEPEADSVKRLLVLNYIL